MLYDDRVVNLFLRWRQLRIHWPEITAEEVCAEAPELTSEVQQHIDAFLSGKKVPTAQGSSSQLADRLAPDTGGPVRTPVPPLRSPTVAAAQPEVSQAGRTRMLGGRYRVEELIGAGTFGQVWRAADPHLERQVAIKLPRPERPVAPQQLRRLLAEARKVARLEQPGIVPIYDVASQGTDYHIVSRFFENGDLARLLAARRPPPAEAARLIAEVADSLQMAHTNELLHGAIKPSNILIDSSGKPWLSDLGLASAWTDQPAEGTSVETIAYLAPEQVRGGSQGTETRSDIYALGIVLYELLTGRLPFLSTSAEEVREQILTREPRSLAAFEGQVPPELERVCLKAMAKRPGERFTTAADFASELRATLQERESAMVRRGEAGERPKMVREPTRPQPRRRPGEVRLEALLVCVYPPGPGQGKRFRLKEAAGVFGRSEECDIRIDDTSVSRQHACIQPGGDGWYVVDQQSTNGTLVNGEPIVPLQPYKLTNGNALQIGNRIFRYLCQSDLEAGYLEEIYHCTVTDALTGLYTRRYTSDWLGLEVAHASKMKQPLTFIRFDVDNHDTVAANLSGLGSELFVRDLAVMLRERVGPGNVFARWGAASFAVVLRSTPVETARTWAEEARFAIQVHIFRFEQTPYTVTISLGLASVGDQPVTADDLLQQAEERLEKAKQSGNTIEG